jgi:hypothetical protein
MNNIHVDDAAMRVAVNCGNSSCTGVCWNGRAENLSLTVVLGPWDWNKLNVTGGKAGPVNFAGIINWSQ